MLNESNEQSMITQMKLLVILGVTAERVKSIDHMIGCDNAACLIQWPHLSCLHLTLEQVLKGKWLCPECRHLKNKSKSRKHKP